LVAVEEFLFGTERSGREVLERHTTLVCLSRTLLLLVIYNTLGVNKQVVVSPEG